MIDTKPIERLALYKSAKSMEDLAESLVQSEHDDARAYAEMMTKRVKEAVDMAESRLEASNRELKADISHIAKLVWGVLIVLVVSLLTGAGAIIVKYILTK
ncbi:hypothetical protein [Chromobacterium haemolyticum]|uniref:hypothetical protein n=1 Tax=Chromobacterium haemolyticum TaxID=394935 RepID=UPI0011319984|nr:hypothetical protein [Chromobacterium haemolyticum]